MGFSINRGLHGRPSYERDWSKAKAHQLTDRRMEFYRLDKQVCAGPFHKFDIIRPLYLLSYESWL